MHGYREHDPAPFGASTRLYPIRSERGEENMRINDIVEVYDGSWSMAIVNGSLEHVIGNGLRNGRMFRVVAKDGEYPTAKYGNKVINNDVILIDVSDPDFVLFTRQLFCQVVTPRDPIIDEVRRKNLETCRIAWTDADNIWSLAHTARTKARETLRNTEKACEDARKIRQNTTRAYSDARKDLDKN